VTERREWHLEPMDPTAGVLTELPHAAWGSPSCRGFLSAVKHGDSAQLVCGDCGDHPYCAGRGCGTSIDRDGAFAGCVE
jgi:hypothetical protein